MAILTGVAGVAAALMLVYYFVILMRGDRT